MRRAGTAWRLLVALGMLLAGCAASGQAITGCEAGQRLAIIAQSVPGAAYLPCIRELPPGWRITSFEVDEDGAQAQLRSDRASEPIELTLSTACTREGSSPIAPRAAGVRSYLVVDSISPSYAGRYVDVFAGGCLTTSFDLERGPHIALLDELRRFVELYPRRQLRQELRADLGVSLDP